MTVLREWDGTQWVDRLAEVAPTDYNNLNNKPTLGTAASKDVAPSGDATAAQVVKGDDSRLTDARTPTSHTLESHSDVLSSAPTNGDGFVFEAGAWNHRPLVKGDVGLGNVDNTSDVDKPVSTAQQTALNAKQDTIPTGTTSQYYRGDKSWQTLDKSAVGLGSVDNTSDIAKPVSTATQNALNLKQNTSNAVTTDTTQTITGNKTFASTLLPSLTVSSTPQMLNDLNLTGASLTVWHDRIRFSTPTYETSPDGTAWTLQSAGTGLGVFTARSDQGVSIADTARWVRWTWNDSSLSYSQMQRLLLKFGYVTPNPSVNVWVWSSADGITWTNRLTTTLSGASAQQWVTPVTDPGSDPWYRIQLQIVGGGSSGTVARPVSIEAQTARFGDQGSGLEREWPFNWYYDRSVSFVNAVNVAGTLTVPTIALTNALTQAKTHASPDTDTAPTALHHTLGTGANQAAAGNHVHAATDVTSGTFNTARLGSGTANTTTWLRGDGSWQTIPAGVTTLAGLTDTTITSPASGQVLRYSGTSWVNAVLAQSDVSGLVAALAAKEGTIAAGTTSQYWRGDKTWQTLDKTAVGLSNVPNVDTTNASNITTGTLPTTVLPPLAINETFTAVSQAAMLALTAQRGDIAIRTDNGKTYVLSTDSPGTLADWKEILASGQVASVNGQTGVVVLAKSDVGLGNVDNTSDVNKPISTATSTALAGKEASITAGTTAQYWRGDKSWQTLNPAAVGAAAASHTHAAADIASGVVDLARLGTTPATGEFLKATGATGSADWVAIDKTTVGLSNVDNTSDVNKPVSTAQQTALNAKENTITAGTSLQYWRGDKSWQTLNLSALPDAWVKRSVKVATTANISLTGTQTIDGVAVVAGDRVLVKNQTTQSGNGIYDVAAGAWARSSDSNTAAFMSDATVAVDQGTQGGQIWSTTFKTTDTLGTTSMLWYRLLDTSMLGVAGGAESFITAGTTAQFWRGDKTWQTLNSTAVGLGNVPNTDATNASNLASGTVPIARLGTAGTKDATTFLRGDNTFATPTATPSGAAGGDLSGTYPNPRLAIPVQISAPVGMPDGHLWYDSDDTTFDNVVPGSRLVSTGAGLTGGGDLSANRTLSVDFATSGAATSNQAVRADDTRLLSNVVRLVHNGTSYPARPTGATYVEWVGPTTPAGSVSGDTWVSTA